MSVAVISLPWASLKMMKRRNEQKGEDSNREQRHNGDADDAHDAADDVGRTDAPRPPPRLPRADAEQPVEEPAVPGHPHGDRLIEGVPAAPAEMSCRIVAFAALPADEIAWMAAGGRLHGPRARPRASHGRRDRRRPARDGFVYRTAGHCGRRAWSSDSSQHRFRR